MLDEFVVTIALQKSLVGKTHTLLLFIIHNSQTVPSHTSPFIVILLKGLQFFKRGKVRAFTNAIEAYDM